jgi:hypothetical protein
MMSVPDDAAIAGAAAAKLYAMRRLETTPALFVAALLAVGAEVCSLT